MGDATSALDAREIEAPDGVKPLGTVRVITVHGTFATHALWTSDDGVYDVNGEPQQRSASVFVSELKSALAANGGALSLENFNWSGENSHQARRAAATELADNVLRRDLADPAYDKVFVVGHSHGGTVTRLALNTLTAEEPRPDGVVTFGSPFVRFKPRSIALLMQALRWIVGGFGALIAGALLFAMLPSVLAAFGVGDLPAWLATNEGGDLLVDSIPLGVAVAVVVVGVLTLRWLGGWFTAMQGQVKQEYDPDETKPTDFLCYHALFDEAGILLRFWSLFSWLMQTAIYTMIYSAAAMIVVAAAFAAMGAIDTAFETRLWSTVESWIIQQFLPSPDALAQLDGPSHQAIVGSVQNVLPFYVVGTAWRALLILLTVAAVASPFALLLPWLLRKQNLPSGARNSRGPSHSTSTPTDCRTSARCCAPASCRKRI